ncbi:hypothetical protein [Argonema antarcticum]|uniref:hypothetical protein n=1 Tax=Argonema antarcticum TaxID=2942763 RepID=UPI00201219C1|nr:hypothetical protein [Argonema antarcticum]MCL1472350.1 hypothetical protein [Argonema antarcticum A004/B2]
MQRLRRCLYKRSHHVAFVNLFYWTGALGASAGKAEIIHQLYSPTAPFPSKNLNQQTDKEMYNNLPKGY